MLYFDLFLGFGSLISILLGYFGGLSRALTGFSLWLSAFYITLIFNANFKRFLIEQAANAWVSQLSFLILMCVIALSIKSLALLFRQILEQQKLTIVDNVLGIIWGFFRAIGLIKLVFWGCEFMGMHNIAFESTVLQWCSKYFYLGLGL